MRKGDKKNRKRKKTVGVKDLPLKATGGADAKGGATAKPKGGTVRADGSGAGTVTAGWDVTSNTAAS